MDENNVFDVSHIYKAFHRIHCHKHEVPIFFALMKELNLVTSQSLLTTIKNCKNARQLMACIDYDINDIDENGERNNCMKIQIDFTDEHIEAMSECLKSSFPEELHTVFDCLENKYYLSHVLEHVNVPLKLKNSVIELRVNPSQLSDV